MQVLDYLSSPCQFEFEEQSDMDQDLKAVLKELTRSVASLNHAVASRDAVQPVQAPPVVPPTRNVMGLLGAAVAVLTILGAFWGVLKYTISSELTSALIAPNQQIATLVEDGKYLRRDVDELRTQRSTEVLSHPADWTPKAIGQAAKQLQAQKVQLPRQLVINNGDSLLKQAKIDPDGESWSAATDVIAYASFLNSNLIPHLGEKLPIGRGDFHFTTPEEWSGHLSITGTAVAQDFPQLHPFGYPDENAGKKSGPAFIVARGGSLPIDNLYLKHVVIVDAEVIYSGGPVRLEGVYFVNCTFRIARKPTGATFATAMLSQDAQTNVTIS